MMDKFIDDLQTRKILRDLWGNKIRTGLTILMIALGVFAVGSIARAWVLLSRNLSDNYLAASPASATITTNRSFDEALVKNIRRMPQIQEAEGRNDLTVRVKVGQGRWYPLRLIARTDYQALTLDKVQMEQGPWPPPRHAMLLERSSLALLNLKIGDKAVIELPSGKLEEITLAGTAHDLTQTPSSFTNIAYGYITPQTLYNMTGLKDYTILDIVVVPPVNKAHIRQVVEQVADKLEANRIIIASKEIPEPGQHQLNDIIQSVLRLLAMLAVMAIFLCTFLVVNTISTLLAQQVQQIGAIKAVGGRSRGIALMYLKAVVILGIIALVTAVPLGMLMARFSSIFVARLINFDITSFYIPPAVYALELLAGLGIPCLAALYPIISGTRITVREAIQRAAGQAEQFGTGGFEALLNKLSGLPPVLLYALRNIFRRKIRLALALITLSTAGAIFIAVVSVRASLVVTIDNIATYWQEDMSLGFYQLHRFSQVERLALKVPGIAAVEERLIYSGFRVRPDDSESAQQIYLFGVQPASSFLKPTLLEGRWLEPDDVNGVVINVDLLELEPDLTLGSQLKVRVGERETVWQVVGLATSQVVGGGELLKAPIAYAGYPHLAKAFGQMGLVNRLLIRTDQKDVANQSRIMSELEQAFNQSRLRVAFSLLNVDVRTALQNAFGIVLNLLQVMSLLFAVVGGLGLMSMMSLNVLERTREIGVIRVVGGVKKVIFEIVVVEGIFVGFLSWIAGAVLAFPLSLGLNYVLGMTLLRVPLIHIFPIRGIFLWLAIIVILAIIASLIPARNAARISIRETLAYE